MKSTKARIVTTDAEIDEAIAEANAYEQYRPKAVAAFYRAKADAIVIEFSSGVELLIPRALMRGLETATPVQAAEVEIVGVQSGLHWESLDLDRYIPGVIDDVFGRSAWMTELGKIGGASRTDAKQAAARSNGLKGGRPRKHAPV